MSSTTRWVIHAQIIALAFVGANSYAQSVPPTYQPLYTEMQTAMQGVEANLPTPPAGEATFTFSAETLYANGNAGLSLLKPGVRDSYLHELQALKSLGVSGVVIAMGFPLLYEPFYQSIGDDQDYQPMLSFFQQLIVDIHSLGMKAIVESQCMYPGYYSSAAGFNVAAYLGTLSLSEYEQGRSAQVLVIYSQVKPDYLDLGSEPDTEASNSGQSGFLDPNTWAAAVASYIQALPSGTHSPLIGTGVGNWRTNDALQYIQAEAAIPGLDYIDLHLYPVVNLGSTNTFQFALTLIDAAHTAGKPVAMSEFWLLKIDSADLTQNNSQNPATASLNAYSFFQPLDAEFLTDMWKIANQKQFLYGSAFWSRYFWAYLPYSSTGPAPGEALDQAASQAAGQALFANTIDTTAQKVQTLASAASPTVVIVSSANYSTEVAVGSLATIFGTNLTTGTASGLSNILSGASISVMDDAGKAVPAALLYASPGQINFVVPTGLQAGTATVTISAGTGTQRGSLVLSLAAPGLFSENAGGGGVAAAQTITVESGGAQVSGVAYTCASGTCKPLPIDLSKGSVYVILYGTGVSGAGQSNVTATIDGQSAVVQFAGQQGQFVGLDQINVLIPSTLSGAGVVPVQISADGITSNTVQIQIQ